MPNLLRSEIGLVGGKLTHSDGRLYAAGLVLGIAGAVGRWHHGWDASLPGHGGWLSATHEVSALPWQFLAVRRDVFLDQGGFDSAFAQSGFDVDLALRLQSRLNLRHLCLPATAPRSSWGIASTHWNPGRWRMRRSSGSDGGT
jgi:hypothetical protein